MSTVYKYNKCKGFGFVKSFDILAEHIPNLYEEDSEDITIIQNKASLIFDEDFVRKVNSEEEPHIFIINLEAKVFSDINILSEESKDKKLSSEKHDEKELNKIMTGNSSQLEAFSKNIYTVIHGKKTANIPQGHNNIHIFNHNVIDSLARNGIISDQNSSTTLSVHILMNELEKINQFIIYFIHNGLELDYTFHESPNDISHPVYYKGIGEITAVFYRNLLLRFFPYLTIVSESMRENAYLF